MAMCVLEARIGRCARKIDHTRRTRIGANVRERAGRYKTPVADADGFDARISGDARIDRATVYDEIGRGFRMGATGRKSAKRYAG